MPCSNSQASLQHQYWIYREFYKQSLVVYYIFIILFAIPSAGTKSKPLCIPDNDSDYDEEQLYEPTSSAQR